MPYEKRLLPILKRANEEEGRLKKTFTLFDILKRANRELEERKKGRRR